jgi:hypothetical protein
MTSKTNRAWERACRIAVNRGRQDGHNAAEWQLQDLPGGGRYWDRGYRTAEAAAIVAGLDDGDPMVLDSLHWPDFSGQWAGGADWDSLARYILDSAGVDYHAEADGECQAEGSDDPDCECWQSDDGNADLMGEYGAGWAQGAEMTIRRAMVRAMADNN